MGKRKKAKATPLVLEDDLGQMFDDLRNQVVTRYGFGLSDDLWKSLPSKTKADYLTAAMGVIKMLAPAEG